VKKFAINGSFLLERTTGIHRYALELICALDKLEIIQEDMT
jgi:hypothetical protein